MTTDPRPAGPEPVTVNPVPTPFAWGVHRVVLGDVEGRVQHGIRLVLEMVTGSTVVFLDDNTAKEMARLLTQHATGLHLPPSGNGSRP